MGFSSLLPCVILALTAAACSSSSPNPSAPPTEAPDGEAPSADAGPATCPEGTPFKDVANKIVVDVTVDGNQYKVVYDSGAPTSVFDTSVQGKLGTGAHTIVLAGKSVELPSLEFMKGLGVGKIPGVVGIVGTDVVGTYAVSIDFPRSRLWLDEARDDAALLACAHVKGSPVNADFVAADYLYVPGHLESKEGWFLVDTGASYGAVPKSIFKELSTAKPRPALPGFYTPAAVGTFWAELSTVGAIEVAGASVSRVLIRTIDDGILGSPGAPMTPAKPLLGLLPHDFFANFVVTIDFPQKKLRFDAAKDAPMVGVTKELTAGIGLENVAAPPIHVARVLPKSSAADQGVVEGDEVVAIDTVPIGDIDVASRPFRLVSTTNGSVVVTVSHAGVARDVTLEMRDLLTPP